MMSADDISMDDSDDDMAFADIPAAKTNVLLLAEKADLLSLTGKTTASHPSIEFLIAAHPEVKPKLEESNAAVVILEIRVLEAFEDLSVIREIRALRPLVPVIAISANLDPDFILEAYKAGANDYVSEEITAEVLGHKILSFNKLAESARLIEVQNSQLVSTMKAQREADEQRMAAEKERSVAAAQAEANKATKEILDNLKEGFFVVEKDLVVGQTTSLSCVSIFEREIAGLPVDQALPLEGQGALYVRVSLEQLFENIMPIEITLSLLPKRWQTRSGKIIEVVCTPIFDDAGNPIRAIIAASDVTQAIEEKRKLERINAINRSLIQIMHDRSSFFEFMGDFKRDIGILATTEDIAVGKRILHTLKGNSAAFDLIDVADLVHHIEDDIAKIEDDATMLQKMNVVSPQIMAKLSSFLNEYSELLQLKAEGEDEEVFALSGKDLETLEGYATSNDAGLGAFVTAMGARLRMVPIARLTKTFKQTVERIGMRQRKGIVYRTAGTDLLVDSRKFGSLFRNLIHAIRNSCDHGIEGREDRTDKGKAATGFISMKVSANDRGLQLTVLDDGKGLDREKIVGKAVEKGLITQDEGKKMGKNEWVHLIFRPGFSTAENVSNLSGRGIGMDCIKTEVERLGGSLDVKTKKDVGTQLIIQVPLTIETTSVAPDEGLKLAS